MERKPFTALGLLVPIIPEEYSSPRPANPELAAPLQWAIDNGIMTLEQARDVDALADGLVARVREGEITEEQGHELAAAAALRDGQAVNRARARAREQLAEVRRRASVRFEPLIDGGPLAAGLHAVHVTYSRDEGARMTVDGVPVELEKVIEGGHEIWRQKQ